MERSLQSLLILAFLCVLASPQQYSNGCATIDANFNCLSCHDRYYFKGGICFPVNSLCDTYNLNTGDCLTCVLLYTVSSGICLPTPIPNCQTQVATTCSLCKPNYYLYANACYTADPQCSSYSNGKCLACSGGLLPFQDVCLVNIPNCAAYAVDNSCTACALGFLHLPANKDISSSATDQCVSVCPYNSSVHTFADFTLKQCLYACIGDDYGDFNSEGHPICTPNCVNSAFFRHFPSKLCVASCPEEDASKQITGSYGNPVSKNCVFSCPANTFINLEQNRTCLSKCGSGKWGDSFTLHCTAVCSSSPSSGKQYFGENTTQLCLAACPLPSVPDRASSICVPTPHSEFQGRWQASGNMADYVKDVHTFIDASLQDLANSALPANRLAKSISDALNAQWSTAWNVFVVKTDSLEHSNSVVYGYAFESHWMWINGYGQFDHSFIIWKDFNCFTWVDLENSDPSSTLPEADATVVNNYVNSRLETDPADYFDPWIFAYDTVSYLNGRDTLRSYTAVVSQGHLTFYNARFCGFGGEYQGGVKTKDGFTLTYLLIRTR